MCLELDLFENIPPSPELGFTSGTEDAGFSAAAQAALKPEPVQTMNRYEANTA